MSPDKGKQPPVNSDQVPKESKSNEIKLKDVEGRIDEIKKQEGKLEKEVKGLFDECNDRLKAIKEMLGDKTLEKKEIFDQLSEINYDLDVIFHDITKEKTSFYRETINRAAVRACGADEEEESKLRYVNKEWWQLSKVSKNLQSLTLNTFQKDFFIDKEKGAIQIRDDEGKMINDERSMELVETLFQESGLDKNKILEILQNQKNQIEDRARSEAGKGASWKKVLAKGALYAGGAAAASLILGTGGAAGVFIGAGLGAARVVDAWWSGRKLNEDFIKAKKNIHGNLLDNLDRKNNDLWRDSLENFSIELAVAKQQQINSINSSVADREDVKNTLSEIIPKEKDGKPNPEFETVLNSFEALSKIEEKNTALEEKLSNKGWFQRQKQNLEDGLKKRCPDFSAYLFQKNPAREKTLTAAIFAGAGLLARAVPGVRTAMLSYSGWKLGGVAAEAVTGRMKHYEILKDVGAKDLEALDEKPSEEQRELLARARVQLADQDYRKKNSTEYAKLLMRVQEITTKQTIDKAEHAMEYVNFANQEVEEVLTNKVKLKEEKAVAVYAGKALGAMAGALLGEWLNARRQEAIANKPKAEELAKLRHDKLHHPVSPVATEPGAQGEPTAKPPEHIFAGGSEDSARELGIVHKGQGVEHAFRRQIEKLATTEEGRKILGENGWDGDKNHLKDFSGKYAHRIALDQGYVEGKINVGVRGADKYQYVLDWSEGKPKVFSGEVGQDLGLHEKGVMGAGEYKFHYEPTPKVEAVDAVETAKTYHEAVDSFTDRPTEIFRPVEIQGVDGQTHPIQGKVYYDDGYKSYYAWDINKKEYVWISNEENSKIRDYNQKLATESLKHVFKGKTLQHAGDMVFNQGKLNPLQNFEKNQENLRSIADQFDVSKELNSHTHNTIKGFKTMSDLCLSKHPGATKLDIVGVQNPSKEAFREIIPGFKPSIGSYVSIDKGTGHILCKGTMDIAGQKEHIIMSYDPSKDVMMASGKDGYITHVDMTENSYIKQGKILATKIRKAKQ